MAQPSISAIYDRIHSASGYHPLSAATFTDWSLEAGDIITLNRDGKSYSSPVHASQLVWKGAPQIFIESTGNREKEAVAVMSSKKLSGSARGGSGYRNSREKNTSIQQNEDSIILEAHNRESADGILYSQITITAEAIRSEVANTAEGLYSTITQTADRIEAEVTDVNNSLSSRITQTATQIRSEVNDSVAGLQSSITQTATQIRSEVSSSVNNLQSRITQEANRITQEVSRATSAESGLSGRITVEAGRITQEVTDRQNADTSLGSRITQESDRISLVVEGTGANAKIKPASIVSAINAQTGQSTVKIAADMIVLDGEAIATALHGQQIDALSFMGNDFNVVSGLYFDQDAELGRHTADDLICKAEVSGNTLTLTPYRGEPITFSKATSLSGAWSGSRFTATASPQGETISRDITHSAPYLDENNHWKVEVYATVPGTGTPPTEEHFGHNINIYNYLQDKTGTNKITSNGTYTPTGSNIGFSEVQVDVTASHTPTIDNVWTSSSIPSGATQLNSLKTQYEAAKDDGDNFCIRVDCNGTKKTYYCTP